MFIRPCYRRKNGKRHAYWALVESYRTARGPRQRTVAYVGQLDAGSRLGVKRAAEGDGRSGETQLQLWEDDTPAPEWVEVNTSAVRVENQREFGGPWLALRLIERLKRDAFLRRAIPKGHDAVPWSVMAQVLVICRLCRPSSELHIAEHYYKQTAMNDLLGVVWHAAGLRGLRRQPQRCDHLARDRRDDGTTLRQGGPHLGGRSGHDVEGEHRLPEVGRPALHRRRGEGLAETIRARTARRRLAANPRRAGGEALPVARGRRRGVYPLPQPRSSREGGGDARAVRDSDRERSGEDPSQLPATTLAQGGDRSPRRPRDGPQQPRCRAVRGRRHRRRRRSGVDHLAKERRLVCFLAYVLWKTLGQMVQAADLGDEPRRVLGELSGINSVDVVLPTRGGPEIRRRCVTRPSEHQAILLQRLGLQPPASE